MVIIYKNFEDLESKMNYAKFQDHGASGSKDFSGFWQTVQL